MVRENPGAFRSWRSARRRSRIGKDPYSARDGKSISGSPRDVKHQPNGKCSQLQILNVKWCEQDNALAEHGYGGPGVGTLLTELSPPTSPVRCRWHPNGSLHFASPILKYKPLASPPDLVR